MHSNTGIKTRTNCVSNLGMGAKYATTLHLVGKPRWRQFFKRFSLWRKGKRFIEQSVGATVTAGNRSCTITGYDPKTRTLTVSQPFDPPSSDGGIGPIIFGGTAPGERSR